MWLTLLLSPAAWAANYEVKVGAFGSVTFSPDTLQVNAGDTVTWTADAGHAHNVVAVDGSFRCANGCDGEGGNGNPSADGWSFTRTFDKAGTIDYFCEVHKVIGMTGSVVVKDVAPPVSTPPVSIGPGFTGAWYDPKQSGHGLFLEVLPGSRLLAWWFAFSPDGQQSWFGGVGSYSGNTATIPANLTTGGKWIPGFDPSKVVNTAWGSLNFTFTDCNSGRVDFTSTVAGYGTNHMDLTRLTQPAGLSCP